MSNNVSCNWFELFCIEYFLQQNGNIFTNKTAAFAVYVINWLVFITVVESVYSAVRSDSLYNADYVSFLKVNYGTSWERSNSTILFTDPDIQVLVNVLPDTLFVLQLHYAVISLKALQYVTPDWKIPSH
jgi:hypothetical protein